MTTDSRAAFVDATWQPTIRTGACDNSGGSCVDIAVLPDGTVGTRNPDNPASVTVFSPADWTQFVDKARAGILPSGSL